ncbi:signal peptidase I [Christensenella sp. NSJ-35]|uniref:Signal peptidase I n=2 Tax=Christensenella tenuis TaxID=2763033 RepID=A0ABR7EAN4_9FIRM|nr:signal peptidase I [Christensenella tenuis]
MTKSRAIWGWVISIIAAVAIAFVVRTFFFEIIVVDGESMLPTLQSDEKLAVEKVSRYFGLPEHGDIIIVHYPNMSGTYVKRVIALPGETVEVKDSTVYVNGEALSEPYINNAEPYMDMAAVTVPEDTVFVMGDNRAHSLDSRTSDIGPIARSEIVGHAMSVIWPLDNIHSVQ